jgi:hypothetical protein
LSKLNMEIEKSGLSSMFTKVIWEIHEKGAVLVSLVQDFDLDKRATFYVWDTSGDIEAWNFAWVKTIWIWRWYQHKDILSKSAPDFLIDDIVEIKNIV